MLNAVVVGCGMWGRNHARVYSELPDVNLIGVIDKDQRNAEEVAKMYNTHAYASLNHFYRDSYRTTSNNHIHIASIATPVSTHVEVAKEFIKSSNEVSLLIEKPIAMTEEEVDELIACRVGGNNKIMIGHIERFNPVVQNLKSLIDSGGLGKILSCTVNRSGLRQTRITDVGVLMDIGIHDFDLMHYLFDNTKSIYTIASTVEHSYEDISTSIVELENEVVCTLHCNWLTPYKQRTIEVLGTKAVAKCDLINRTINIYKSSGEAHHIINAVEPLKTEIEYFVDCVRENKYNVLEIYDGKHALEVALSALKSAESGLKVIL